MKEIKFSIDFMIRQDVIALVIDSQRNTFLKQDTGLTRFALDRIPIAESFATIITGMRRCGKSTLLLQLLKRDYQEAVYLNFDDIRLAGFESDDFVRLHREIEKRKITVLFFDEIHIVKGWEKYINQLLREGYKVFITGSNASMISVELGTYLTGRHLPMELFPFSYSEFIRFRKFETGENALKEYLFTGGLPEFVKTGMNLILTTLVDDILMKDIAFRYSVRDLNSLRQLTSFLIANIGNLVSANKMAGMFGIKSPATFLEYFSFLKDAYLFEFVPLFSHSIKVQARNPKKVYLMDTGIYTGNSVSTSENMGRRLENLVFLHLRRKYSQIYYYKGQGECDFITVEKNIVKKVVQVCQNINDENFEREFNGLYEAMKILEMDEGFIVTFNQSEILEKNGKTIKLIPAHLFFEDH